MADSAQVPSVRRHSRLPSLAMRELPLREVGLPLGDASISYWVAGETGPVLLLCGGLMGGPELWRPLIGHFIGRCRLITWRYRGLLPAEGQPAAPPRHAQDALAILEAEGVDRACVIGWTLGAQIALEIYRQDPRKVTAMALLGGGARLAWGNRQEATFPGTTFPRLLRILQRLPEFALHRAVQLLRSPEVYPWARRMGLLGSKSDAEVFAAALRAFSQIPVDRALATLALAAPHDASSVLPLVTVPTLAVAAGRDPLSARGAVEQVVSEVRGAEYLVLPDATHFMLFDHADHLNLRLDKFLAEHGQV